MTGRHKKKRTDEERKDMEERQPKKARTHNANNPLSVLKAELVEANRQGDVAKVLGIFRKWRADAALAEGMQEGVFAMVLSAILKACTTEAEAMSWWKDAEEAFNGVKQRCKNGRVKENHVTLMVRLSSMAGRTAQAFEYLKSLPRDKVDEKEKRVVPKFRSIMPILEACARVGDLETAEEVFESEIMAIKHDGILTDLEGLQWQDCCFCLLDAAVRSPKYARDAPGKKAKVDEWLRTLTSVVPRLKVTGVSNPGETYHRESKVHLQRILEAAGYAVHPTAEVDPATGYCATTAQALRAIEIPREQLIELRTMIERLAVEGTRKQRVEQWADFRAWMDAVDQPYQHIIDAANVGHALHGCDSATLFSHQQIDSTVVQAPRPLVVIREHWVKRSTDLAVKKKAKKKKVPLPQLASGGAAEAEWGGDDGGLGAQLWEQMGGDEAVDDGAGYEDGYEDGEEDDAAGVEEEGEGEGAEDPQPASSPPPTVAEQYRAKWEKEKCLLLSPDKVNDDWVAMYVAVEMMLRGVKDVRLITNDIFRDHYWRMHHHPAVSVFMERNITKFQFVDGTLKDVDFVSDPPPKTVRRAVLKPPLPYSIKAQQDDAQATWHVPFETSPVTWVAGGPAQ